MKNHKAGKDFDFGGEFGETLHSTKHKQSHGYSVKRKLATLDYMGRAQKSISHINTEKNGLPCYHKKKTIS